MRPVCESCHEQESVILEGFWRCLLCGDPLRPGTPEEIVDYGWDEEAGRPRESAMTDAERNPGLR